MKQKIRTASLLLLIVLGTGLVACPACSRAVLFGSVQVPKPACDLYVRKRKAAALKLRCC